MENITKRELIKRVLILSIPAILAEISSVIMQYIDAAMVGSMGANATAAIGLVTTSTWLIGGLCIGTASGFSVQVSQWIGAGKEAEARDVLRQSLIVSLFISSFFCVLGILISNPLPAWLGGASEIHKDATIYFLIFACTLPVKQMRYLAGSMLQCSGDMKTPSILNAAMCGMDVIFNWIFIFPSSTFVIGSVEIPVYGAGMGVAGAALGTAVSEVIVAVLMLWVVVFRSERLRLVHRRNKSVADTEHVYEESWKLRRKCLTTAAKIAIPMVFEHTVMCGAQVTATRIVAPLGTTSVAANSLAVTAEGLCYMPGYRISSAATTLVGQSIGAGNKKLARRYARISVLLGVLFMSSASVLMYILAPWIFAMMTGDVAVRELGTMVLRIEAFAEPLYAVSIVTVGALRGAGDTLVPSILNLFSMWGVRIVAAALLAPHLGLAGVWIAMCAELCVRGVLFLIRLLREKWLEGGALV